MARRRMIDPNFWQSEDVSKLTIRQRLLLIGLFSNADDEGKMRGNPAFVRSAIFPYEDFTLSEVEEDLNSIELIGSIQQYEVEGSKYIRLINWKKFQRVDKPQSSVIPEPSNIDSENDSKNESDIDSRLKEEKGREKKGEEEKAAHSTFNNPIKDRIYNFANRCEIKKLHIVSAEQELFFFIDKMDIEVIEAALTKSIGTTLNYAVKIMTDWMNEGKTTKESIRQLRAVPDKPKYDPELESRRIEIARNQWIAEGNDPDGFEYKPASGS